jgi:ferrous iron transport protein B
MILGFGCVTMATITTRMLGSERERRIAVFLLGLAIPCSAQLGVIAGLLAGVGPLYALLYVVVIFGVLVMVGTVLNRVLPGNSSDLLIDLPPLRMPRAVNVFQKTLTKSYMFLREASPLFALGAVIISTFGVTGLLGLIQTLLAPLTVGWLQLPKEATTAFIMGIVRRDFGAAGLYGMALNPMQITVALITITLFVPCIASILVIFKERGKKEAAIMWASTWVIAFLVGGLVARLSNLFKTSGSNGIFWITSVFLVALFGIIAVTSRQKRQEA